MLEIHPCVKLNLISLWDGPRSTIGTRWNVNLTVDPNIELNRRINVRCSLSLIFHVCVCVQPLGSRNVMNGNLRISYCRRSVLKRRDKFNQINKPNKPPDLIRKSIPNLFRNNIEFISNLVQIMLNIPNSESIPIA